MIAPPPSTPATDIKRALVAALLVALFASMIAAGGHDKVSARGARESESEDGNESVVRSVRASSGPADQWHVPDRLVGGYDQDQQLHRHASLAVQAVHRAGKGLDAAAAAADADRSAGAKTELIVPARILFAEAGFHAADHRAILWTARKSADRVGRSWRDTIASYSSLARSHSARARKIRAMPDGDVPDESAAFNAQWRAVRELVARFDEAPGSVVDPCRAATHYGGDMDAARGGMVPARCSERTVNTFYRVTYAARAAR